MQTTRKHAFRFTFIAILAVAQLSILEAEIRLPKIFTQHMILQQQMPIRVWGWAAKDEAVTVEFNEKSASTKANADGRWQVELPAMSADGVAHTLVVKGSNTITLTNVALGEVWLGVGQSNMSRGLRYVKDRIKKEPMDFQGLRLFFVGLDQVPQREQPATVAGWAPATHETMNAVFVHPKLGPYEFSEVTYYFGKTLHEELKIPVGVISAAFPGSTAAQWTPEPPERFDFASGKPDKGPGGMWQSMLNGIAPFSIRGAIYYQGENDGGNAHYDRDLIELIARWRKNFQRPDMPFLMAQIAQTTFSGGMLRVTECQQLVAETVPQVAVAPSNDLWDNSGADRSKIRADAATNWPIVGGGDPHPPNKHLMSIRLAKIALAQTYKKSDAEVLAPTVEKFESHGETIAVKFKHAGIGLATDDKAAPNWFEIANEDKKYAKADAKIVDANTIEIRAENIKAPKHFRFAWHALARHNLYNSSHLPALSFRSDAPKEKQ